MFKRAKYKMLKTILYKKYPVHNFDSKNFISILENFKNFFYFTK